MGRIHSKERQLVAADPGIHIGIHVPCHLMIIVPPLEEWW